MSMYSKCKSVISNPFSTATNQPKIPDGRAPASMGGKRNLMTTINFDQYDTWDIIISPRFDTPIYYATETRATNAATPVIDGIGTFMDNHPFTTSYVSTDSTTQAKQNTSSEISKIRLVSQGTKITLTNSTDDNDGYFEAFRFAPGKSSQTYLCQAATGTAGEPYLQQTKVATDMFDNNVRPAVEDGSPFVMNLASKGNYVTGKLRNLHRYTWVNKPQVKDVDFKDLPTNLNVGAAPTATSITSAAAVAWQDWDYDVIWIRVHGRGIPTAQQGGCCLPTKLMVHCTQNIECVFGEQNLMHSFMTKSPVSGGYRRAGSSLPYMPMRRYYTPYRRYARRTYTRKRSTVSKRRMTRKKY